MERPLPQHRATVLARRSRNPGRSATRLAGSADVFAPPRPVARSINFITAHDGFTLADLVAYTAKRNAANGEANRDGH